MTTKTVRAFGAMLLATLILAGCSPVPPQERPDIAWVDGEPTGPLEDNPWVQAVRASELELAVADYTLNFSTRELAETTSSSRIESHKSWLESEFRNGRNPRRPGLDPMIPIHVSQAPDGQSASVWVCHAAYDWKVTTENPDPPMDPIGIYLHMKVTVDNGNRIVEKDDSAFLDMDQNVRKALESYGDDRKESDCTLDNAAIGLFDPAPDLNEHYRVEQIR